jgi:hypothetical protein
VLQGENQRLRDLAKGAPPQPAPKPIPTPVANKSDREKQVAGLIEAVKGLDSVDGRGAALLGIASISGDITGEELASILDATTCDTVDRRLVIMGSAERLRYPLEPKTVGQILAHLDSIDRSLANAALVRASQRKAGRGVWPLLWPH